MSEKFSLIIQEKDETDLRPVFTDEGYFLYTDTYSLAYSLTYSLTLPLANLLSHTSLYTNSLTLFLFLGITYVYIKCNNLLLLAVTKRNSNIALILFYLYRLTTVFKEYFGELEEESIRDNFVVVYELLGTHSLTHSLTHLFAYSLTYLLFLDETMDFGYPQSCEAKILKDVVTQEGNRLEVAPRPPIALTNAVSWRSEGKHLLTGLLTHSLTCLLTHSLTYSLTYLLTHLHTYLLTYLLTCYYSFKA